MHLNSFIDRYAAILVSRQQLRPNGRTPWVAATVEAVRWLSTLEFGVVSSVGMQTWELVTALAVAHKLPLRLVVPANSTSAFRAACRQLRQEYRLSQYPVEFIPTAPSDKDGEAMLRDGRKLLALRDSLVVDSADLLIPVSIRPRGHMVRLINAAAASGTVVERRFSVESSMTQHKSFRVEVDHARLNCQLDNIANRYVIHWTRATNGPWPGERLADFYADLIDSESWPRDGFSTLSRIVHEGYLVASSENMPDGVSTVSFSDLPPRLAVKMMTWRARYNRMAFEPYGVGIARATAGRLGIKAVEYYDPKKGGKAPSVNRWLSQSVGRRTDWRAEQEFRCRGDFSLSNVSADNLIVFCHTEDERLSLKRRCPYRVVAIEASRNS